MPLSCDIKKNTAEKCWNKSQCRSLIIIRYTCCFSSWLFHIWNQAKHSLIEDRQSIILDISTYLEWISMLKTPTNQSINQLSTGWQNCHMFQKCYICILLNVRPIWTNIGYLQRARKLNNVLILFISNKLSINIATREGTISRQSHYRNKNQKPWPNE